MSSRGVWVYDHETQQLLPKAEYQRLKASRTVHKGSAFGCPAVIGTMPAIRSMADGKIYDDKRGYQKSVARAGCEIVGFDKNWEQYVAPRYDEKKHEADIVGDVKKAIEQVSSL